MIDHNQRYVVVVLVLLGTFFYPVTSQISVIDKRSLVNTCIDGNNHKREPGPEDDLHKQVITRFLTFKWVTHLITAWSTYSTVLI